MSGTRKRNRSGDNQHVSPSVSSNQIRSLKRAKTKYNLNQHSYNLSQLDFNAGYKYIVDNNLEERLRNEVESEDDEKTIYELWISYFEINIYKPDIQLKETEMLPIPSEIILPKPSEIILPKPSEIILSKNILPKKVQQTRRGGSISHAIRQKIFFKEHFNTLTVLSLRDIAGKLICKVYGSSLPYGDNTQELYRYFYNSVGIKTIISLQACGTTTDVVHLKSCDNMKWSQIRGSKTEREIWEKIEVKKHKSKFIEIEWKDMTAPSFDVMDEINGYPIWSSPTLIHCYAGFGRTGTILFLFWFRWTILNKMFVVFDLKSKTDVQIGYQALLHPFLKCAISPVAKSTRSSEMYFRLLLQFNNCLSIGYLDPKFTVGSTYTIERMCGELFKIETLTSANLFVARMNYVLLYIALFLNEQVDYSKYLGLPPQGGKITSIYLYPLHNNYPLRKNKFDEHTIFQSPTPTHINTYVANNNFGLKPVNIPYTGVAAAPALASSTSASTPIISLGSSLSTP